MSCGGAVQAQYGTHAGDAEQTERDATEQPRRHPQDRVGVEPGQRELQHHHREDRAERVDQHALAQQHGAHVLVEPRRAHERGDDRRAGDGDERAEHKRRPPRQHLEHPGEQRRGGEGDREADREQVAHHVADAAQVVDVDRERALEDEQRDEYLEGDLEDLVQVGRVEYAEHRRPGDDTREE